MRINREFDPTWREARVLGGHSRRLRRPRDSIRSPTRARSFFDESRSVFERAWVCVGIAADAAPGRVLVRSLGRRSILITRNADGELHGFLNSCRHRGTELYESRLRRGLDAALSLPPMGIHLDGSLKSTPLFDDVPRDDFDPADYSLAPVGSRRGVCCSVRLSRRQTRPSTNGWAICPTGWPATARRLAAAAHPGAHDQRELEADLGELPGVLPPHLDPPGAGEGLRVEDHYRYQGAGMYCGQTTTPVVGRRARRLASLPPADGLDESDAVSGRFVAIFPNVLLSVLPNHVFVMQLDPIAPGVTIETCTWLLPEDGRRCDRRGLRADPHVLARREREDIDIVERGQRGLTRGAVPPGPLAPRFEEPLHRFHNILANLMTLDRRRRSTSPKAMTARLNVSARLGQNPHPPIF